MILILMPTYFETYYHISSLFQNNFKKLYRFARIPLLLRTNGYFHYTVFFSAILLIVNFANDEPTIRTTEYYCGDLACQIEILLIIHSRHFEQQPLNPKMHSIEYRLPCS